MTRGFCSFDQACSFYCARSQSFVCVHFCVFAHVVLKAPYCTVRVVDFLILEILPHSHENFESSARVLQTRPVCNLRPVKFFTG